MEQNSESWYEWRRNGLGASDAPIILGKSKYSTPRELFLEKCGLAPPKPVNEFITSLGHRFEPRALAYYNLMNDTNFTPQVVEMEEYGWLRASLDGQDINVTETPQMEIKYVGKKKIDDARTGTIDPAHWIQLQHQMMVTGANKCIYLCYTLEGHKNLDEIHYLPIDYDEKFVLNDMWPKLFEFWERVKKKEWK